ncbi:hypothetical protein SDC9_99773 [bioreactor metagenome]|uniref:Yip1 domain-containing protein n=1 Tax=bioreactor metagenome TaxID=1076179 RepID=A0A645AIL1_9ZZZZ
MEIINKVKNILLNPKTEWETISEKNDTHVKVLTAYLIPLALIPTIAGFIGYGILGYGMFVGIGVRYALSSFISTIGGAYLSAWIISFLADKFESDKSFDKAFSLVAYSYTPMCVAGILLLFPQLSFVVMLGGLYGLYLLYLGLTPMMKTPEEKKINFFIVSLLCVVAVTAVVSAVLGALIVSSARFIY